MNDNQYDDTNRGVAFPPYDNQQMILQGKLNIQGSEDRIILVKNETKSGTKLIEVYAKIGVLFNNDKGKEGSPDYTGPMEVGNLRLAAWKKIKDGMAFMSLQLTIKQDQEVADIEAQLPPVDYLKDDIPF